jgi:hypothetical protein
MIVFGISWKCEGPFQVTDIEEAKISLSTGPITQNYLYELNYSRVSSVKTQQFII